MNLQYHFVHITDALKEDLKDYASKRFEHLETFLHSFPEDNKMLKVDIEHHEKHNEFEIKCTLTIGGTVLHHEEVTHNPKEAIDKSEANLIRQVKKSVDKMRDKPHVGKMDAVEESEDYSDV